MAVKKRLALAISGAAFAGAAALTMGVASPAEAATTSAPASTQHLVSCGGWGWGCGGCWDWCDDWCDWGC